MNTFQEIVCSSNSSGKTEDVVISISWVCSAVERQWGLGIHSDISTPPLSSYVSLGKFLDLLELQFLQRMIMRIRRKT